MQADVDRIRELRLSGYTVRDIAADVGATTSRVRYVLGCLLDRGEITPAREQWTGEGIHLVDSLTKQGYRPREIAAHLGRSLCAIRSARPWAQRGAGRRHSRWTEDDDRMMHEMLSDGRTVEHVATRLGRTVMAVARRRSRISRV